MASDSSLFIFTYGPLRRGECNDIRWLGEVTFIGYGDTCGYLYDMRTCPRLITCTDGQRVTGEIFRINASLIPILDQVEDDCGEYLRKFVDVVQENPVILSRPISESSRCQIAGKPLIAGGDWIRRSITMVT